ncbi:MAG: acetyltransferase [Bacteroidetes bacterium]|nr:MAG: acetyltransferase [Bacteroidota bacterium]
MRSIIQYIVKLRNPSFQFDTAVDNRILLEFLSIQLLGLIRGSRMLLKGKNPKFMLRGKGVKFIAVSRIRFGKFLKLGDYVTFSGLGREGIKIGKNVGIGSYSKVIVSTSLNAIGYGIKIGNNVGIGEFAYLGGAGGLEIGDDCIIGQYLSCHPENHNYGDVNLPIRLQGVNRHGIKIGANCWMGSKVTILDGVTIGDGCVIAAGAVVTKSFPANSVIGGLPAKLLKTRV